MNHTNKKTVFLLITITIIAVLAGGLAFYLTKRPPERKGNNIGKAPQQQATTQEEKTREKSSSCVVLDEGYCKKGEPLYDKNNKFIGLGFDLPVGAKIYSPFDGYIDNNIGVEIFPNQLQKGFSVSTRQADKQMDVFTVVGSIKTIVKPEHIVSLETPELLVHQAIKKGKVVATVEKSPIRIIAPDGEKSYAIAVDFATYGLASGSQTEHDLDLFQQFFGDNNFDKTK